MVKNRINRFVFIILWYTLIILGMAIIIDILTIVNKVMCLDYNVWEQSLFHSKQARVKILIRSILFQLAMGNGQ